MPKTNDTAVLNANERQIIRRMSEIGYEISDISKDKTDILFKAIGHGRTEDNMLYRRFHGWSEVLDTINEVGGEDCIPLKQSDSKRADSQPVYKNTLDYAARFKEATLYMNSVKANRACLKDLQKRIPENFDGLHISENAVFDMIMPSDGWGRERMEYVLVNIVESNRDAYGNKVQKWADSHIANPVLKDEDFAEKFPDEYGYSMHNNPYKSIQGIYDEQNSDVIPSDIDNNKPIEPYLMEGFIRQAIPVLNNEFIEQTAVRMNNNGKPEFETDTRPSAGLDWVDPCTVSKTIYDYVALNLYGRSNEDMGFHIDRIESLYDQLNQVQDSIADEIASRSAAYEKLQIAQHDMNAGLSGAEKNVAVLAEQIGNSNNIIKELEETAKDIKKEISILEQADNRTGINLECVRLYGDRAEKCVSDKKTPIQAVIGCSTDSPSALEAFNKALADDPLVINGIHVEMTATDNLENFMEEHRDSSLRHKIYMYVDMIPKSEQIKNKPIDRSHDIR